MFPSAETALTHILVVHDPGRSRSWYTDVLGASLYREYGASVVLSFAGAWLGTARAKDRVVEFFRLSKPLNTWLRNNVGDSTLAERTR